MKIFRKIFAKTGSSDQPQSPVQATGTVSENRIGQKLENIYGKEKIELQMLYERWVIRDDWLLKNEALPLLSGIDPESNIREQPEQLRINLDQLWEHAKNCVEQGLLRVSNREQPEIEWRVTPLDVYQWARISRIDLPEALSMLMEFVAKTIKPATVHNAQVDHNSDQGYSAFDQDRERVLGMALALLAACPDKCRNSRGKVKPDKLVSLIGEKGKFWLGDETLELSPTAMKDLLGKWLNTLPENLETSE